MNICLNQKVFEKKSLLTHSFIERKRKEFWVLKAEIKALKEDVGLEPEAMRLPTKGKQ